MSINLIVKKEVESLIEELLISKGVTVDKESKFNIIQRGLEKNEGFEIIFDMNNIHLLIEFLQNNYSDKDDKIKHLVGKKDDSYEILNYPDVIYIEAQGNLVYCKTSKGIYRLKEKLYELDERLQPQGFIRISKSTIINIVNVAEIKPHFGGRLLLKLNETAVEKEVSKSFVKEFKDFLGL